MRCMQLRYDRSRSKAPPSAVREMQDMRTECPFESFSTKKKKITKVPGTDITRTDRQTDGD